MRYIGLDIESKNLHPYNGTIWILSLTEGTKTKNYYDCFGNVDYFRELKPLLEDKSVCKIIHSSEFDAPYIQMQTTFEKDIYKRVERIKQIFFSNGIKIKNIWDSKLCETVIQGTQIPRKKPEKMSEKDYNKLQRKHSAALQYVLPRYGFPEPDKSIRNNFIDRPVGRPITKKELEYAGDDSNKLPQIQKAQEYILTREGLMEVALLENKVAERVAQMKVCGLGIDKTLWLEIADRNLQHYRKLIYNLPKDVTNWNSPKQVKDYFYGRGIHIDSLTNIENIQAKCNDKVLAKFIEARKMYSDATAYGATWLLRDDGTSTIDPDGRIRCSWQQIINTGRFATSNPNILALPKEGNQRSAIVPRKGYCFVIGDYSGQEIGIMACASGEDLWIEALMRGESVHSLIASRLFEAEWHRAKEKGCIAPFKCKCKGHQDMPGMPYYKAKKLNFMLAYGGGAAKFAEITGCDMLTASVTVTKYKRLIPNMNKWLENNGKEALATGVTYSADPYKRRLFLKGQEDWMIINQGKNYPVQGAGANMLKLAMISIPEVYDIALPFHDELVLEVPIKDAKKVVNIQKEIMEQSSDYITGVKGVIKVKPRIAMNFAKV